jgi:hypothetical protein
MLVIFLSTPFFELFTIMRLGLLMRCMYLQYYALFEYLNKLYIICYVTYLIEKLLLIKSDSF